MATTPTVSDRPATQRQYVTQLTISAAIVQAIAAVWESTSPTSSPAAWSTFTAAVKAFIPQYGQMAARVALDNYQLARRDAGITTVARLPRITPVPDSKIDAGLAWARRAANQADQLGDLEQRIRNRAAAAMQKAVMDEARETTVEAVDGDERALGFRRVPRPDACAWCLALATRKTSRKGLAADFDRYGVPGVMGGDEHWGVYKSRASAGQVPANDRGEINRFHNGCNCAVEPIFTTAFIIPSWLREIDELYQSTDDFNHFRRLIEARRRGETAPDPTPLIPAPSANPAQLAAIADLLGGIDTAMRAA